MSARRLLRCARDSRARSRRSSRAPTYSPAVAGSPNVSASSATSWPPRSQRSSKGQRMGMSKMRPLPIDLWTDEDLIALPLPVKWTAIGLRMHADDEGRESVTDWMLRPSIWPGDATVTADVLTVHLLMLDQAGVIGIYSAGDRTYYQVRSWPAVSHPNRSKHPPPPPDLFQNAAGNPPDDFSAGEGESESRETNWERPAGIPPSPFCTDHPRGTRQPCRHCGTARLLHEQYLAESRAGRSDDGAV